MDNFKKIACVTGASGIVGGRIMQRLVAQGYQVRALSRKGNFSVPDVEVFRGGLENEKLCHDFLRNAQLLFHCAAELRDESKMWEVNVAGTERLLRAARQSQIEYVCHMSSAGVIGATKASWVDESTPCNPQNSYERSKYQAEQVVRQYQGSLRVVILRPTNVIDEFNHGALALPIPRSWVDRLALVIKGGECAHVIHAADVAAAALYFIDRPSSTPECFFVSCDHDPRNTFAGLWALNSALRQNLTVDQVSPRFLMPIIVPYLLRRLCRGKGNRGDVRYSPKRLLATGFAFPLGLTGAVKEIYLQQTSSTL